MTSTHLFGLLGVMLLALGTACAGGTQQAGGETATAQEVTVEARDFSFQPAQVTVQAGSPVNLSVRNTGAVRHDWVVDLGSERVEVVVDPGQTQSVTFTPPTAGTFEILCTEPGHDVAGMKGTLVVN